MPHDLEFKIAILGAGNVGANLGRALAAKGHTIVYGIRNPASEKARAALATLRDKAIAAGISDAIAIGDLIVLAIGWPDAGEIVKGLADQLAGKILIDATNRFGQAARSLTSAAEDLQRLAPGARVVKCFNTIGVEHYLDPMFDGKPALMPFCGDDEEAKNFVGWLVSDLGFEMVDAGPLANAEMLEGMGRLWVSLARGGMGRDIAFRVVKK